VESSEAEIVERSAAEVAALRAAGDDFLLLDVREAEEVETARIEGAIWIPLGDLERRSGEISDWKRRRVVVHCHAGVRSLQGCRILQGLGFERAESMAGGIDAWTLTVDSDVPRY
jgi:rhodanese-related sulfurtransferase